MILVLCGWLEQLPNTNHLWQSLAMGEVLHSHCHFLGFVSLLSSSVDQQSGFIDGDSPADLLNTWLGCAPVTLARRENSLLRLPWQRAGSRAMGPMGVPVPSAVLHILHAELEGRGGRHPLHQV